jgi:hypothetical protein
MAVPEFWGHTQMIQHGKYLPVEEFKGRPLGRVLMKMGSVTRAQVHAALELQKQQNRPLGQILRELGYINEEDLQLALAFQIGRQTTDPP